MNAVKLLLVLIFLVGVAEAGDLYKWTDEKGILHYSDMPPPPEIKAQRVHINSGVTSDSSVADTDKPKGPPADAKPEPPKPPPMQETREFRARLCEQSKANLDLLESKFQVADAQGKPLDAQARAAFAEQSKRAVETNCSAASTP